MTTSVVQNNVTDPTGAPLVGVQVRITLVTGPTGAHPGLTGAASLTQPKSVLTDATGAWSMALTPNAEITQPAGTYYLVSEGGYLSSIVVPVGGGPYNLAALQTGTPPSPGPQYLLAPAAVTVDKSGVAVGTRPVINLIPGSANLSITAADNPGAGRVDVTLDVAGSGAAVNSVFGRSGVVVAQSGDYTAAQVGAAPTASPSFTGTVTVGGRQVNTPVVLTPGATPTANAALGNTFRLTANQNFTLANPTGLVDGQMLMFEITQDATGGRVWTLDTLFHFGTDITSAVLSTAPGVTDYLGVKYRNAKLDVIAFVKGY